MKRGHQTNNVKVTARNADGSPAAGVYRGRELCIPLRFTPRTDPPPMVGASSGEGVMSVAAFQAAIAAAGSLIEPGRGWWLSKPQFRPFTGELGEGAMVYRYPDGATVYLDVVPDS